MKDWFVYVRGRGYIGQVHERNEAHARAAAQSEFGVEGKRADAADVTQLAIFDDDNFYVSDNLPPITTGDGLPPPTTTG